MSDLIGTCKTYCGTRYYYVSHLKSKNCTTWTPLEYITRQEVTSRLCDMIVELKTKLARTRDGEFELAHELGMPEASSEEPLAYIYRVARPAVCYAVCFSNYFPLEMDSVWATKELAEKRCSEITGEWNVVEMEIQR